MPQNTSDSLAALASRLAAARSLLVLTHARPDGDGLGSMAALAAAARAAGKTVAMLSPDGVPRQYAFLFAEQPVAKAGDFCTLADAAEAIVIVDTCAVRQLESLEKDLPPRRDKIVVIDHHATHDDIGAVQWLDASAAAAGVMVGEIIDLLGWPTTQETSVALTAAVLSDTGWLRFSNTDGRTLRAVAKWIDQGVRPDKLYKALYQSDRLERLRLTARMLQSIELHCGGLLAVLTIRREDFDATGAKPEETENLVNEAMRLGGVESAMLLVENGDVVRVSLRSRERIDVSQIAKLFGGGGHARAAGVRMECGIETAKASLIAACREALSGERNDRTS